MPNPQELEMLAERAEKATEPDRELDALIGAAVRACPATPGSDWLSEWSGPFIATPQFTGRIGAADKAGNVAVHWEALIYTASLDAAMTLVPEECLFHVRTLWDGPQTWGYAHVHTYCDDAEDCDGKRHLDDYVGSAATPALALVAACLRARASLPQKEEGK